MLVEPCAIDVCVCTYKRESIIDTLKSLVGQNLPAHFDYRIIISDNDVTPSAKAAVKAFFEDKNIGHLYIHAPANNISVARNACLNVSTGDYLAFLDDDEIADENWLLRLIEKQRESAATAVFGPAYARYPDGTEAWILKKDYHSNIPQRKNGSVETGHTCNALINRRDPAVRGVLFPVEKGKTGGEDTAYFFDIRRNGGKFEIAADAEVYETVEPNRLSYEWLHERKFRYGQSYGTHVGGFFKRASTAFASIFKYSYSRAMSFFMLPIRSERKFWRLRATFHGGVVASFFGAKEKDQY